MRLLTRCVVPQWPHLWSYSILCQLFKNNCFWGPGELLKYCYFIGQLPIIIPASNMRAVKGEIFHLTDSYDRE